MNILSGTYSLENITQLQLNESKRVNLMGSHRIGNPLATQIKKLDQNFETISQHTTNFKIVQMAQMDIAKLQQQLEQDEIEIVLTMYTRTLQIL